MKESRLVAIIAQGMGVDLDAGQPPCKTRNEKGVLTCPSCGGRREGV